ncbi:unnamed protein product, partial [Scytosiphon promiscuus]
IVSRALEYIQDAVVDQLNRAHRPTTLSASDIRWVLTVPAICGSYGKRFMRTAAYRAGLISEEN